MVAKLFEDARNFEIPLWGWDGTRPFSMGFHLFFTGAKFFPWISYAVLQMV